jgi:hypothetical protein
MLKSHWTISVASCRRPIASQSDRIRVPLTLALIRHSSQSLLGLCYWLVPDEGPGPFRKFVHEITFWTFSKLLCLFRSCRQGMANFIIWSCMRVIFKRHTKKYSLSKSATYHLASSNIDAALQTVAEGASCGRKLLKGGSNLGPSFLHALGQDTIPVSVMGKQQLSRTKRLG